MIDALFNMGPRTLAIRLRQDLLDLAALALTMGKIIRTQGKAPMRSATRHVGEDKFRGDNEADFRVSGK
jgi:hypothetical protein